MPIFDLFSKRQKKLRGEVIDTLSYDKIPNVLKGQIVHIIRDTLGTDYSARGTARDAYMAIYDVLCREYGVFNLDTDQSDSDPRVNLYSYIVSTVDTEKILDAVELTFRFISLEIGKVNSYYSDYVLNIKMTPEEAVDELNTRFKEHGIGYQFENNELIRVDSTFIHSEVVKPTLSLLSNKKFKGANDEYLNAHEHYKNNRNKECLVDCLKAFESTIKIICKEKGWSYDDNDTSKKLIQVLFNNNFIPAFTQNQFTSLQSLLESGTPTIRNKTSGHGQGQIPQQVSDEITRYGLNLTGANIIFLIEQSGIK